MLANLINITYQNLVPRKQRPGYKYQKYSPNRRGPIGTNPCYDRIVDHLNIDRMISVAPVKILYTLYIISVESIGYFYVFEYLKRYLKPRYDGTLLQSRPRIRLNRMECMVIFFFRLSYFHFLYRVRIYWGVFLFFFFGCV